MKRRYPWSVMPRRTIGEVALGFSITAAVLAFITATFHGIATGFVGITAASDMSSAPGWYMGLAIVFAILFLVFTLCGISGLIAGIVAIVRNRGRGLGAIAIVLAILGPFFSLLVFVVTAAVGNSIG